MTTDSTRSASDEPRHSETPGPAAGPRAAKTAVGWHAAPWWASVGGVAAVVALLVGVGAWWFPQSPAGPTPAGPTPPPAVSAVTSNASSAVSGNPAAIIATVVDANDSGPDCGGRGYLLDGGLDQLSGAPTPPDELAGGEGLQNWFVAHGGTEVINNVSIAIEGPHTSAAILTGMKPVVDHQVASAGAVVGYWQCGGNLTRREFSADLAAATPIVKGLIRNPPPGLSPAPPATFPFTISATDPEVFTVLLKRPPGDVMWHLEISWTLNGLNGTTRVPATGGFRSTDAPLYRTFPASEFLKHPRSDPNGSWVS